MKRIQHDETKVQQKQEASVHPSSDVEGSTSGPSGEALPTSLSDAAIDVILWHHNWASCSDLQEAIKAWGESTERLEKALRDAGFGAELDDAILRLDEENAQHEAENDL